MDLYSIHKYLKFMSNLIKTIGGYYNKARFFQTRRDKIYSPPSATFSGLVHPQSAVIDRESGRIFVGTADMFKLLVVDYSNPSTLLNTLTFTQYCYCCEIDKDNGRVIVALDSGSPNCIHVFDYTTLTLITQIASQNVIFIKKDVNSNRIFLSQQTSDIQVRDFTTLNLLSTISTGGILPRGIGFDINNNKMYVAMQAANLVYIYDYTTLVKTGQFSCTSPFGLDIDYVNKQMWITSVGGNFINVYDLTSLAILRTIPSTEAPLNSPRFLSIDSYMDRVLIPNSSGNNISILK